MYRLLKESFNKDAEEFFVWVDNNDVMVQIERDYTFQYYVNVMKEHSEKIEELVGQDDAPSCLPSAVSLFTGMSDHRDAGSI